MKRTIIYIFIYISAFINAYSQQVNQPIIFQSPEASSLIKEVTTPVSLSSGTTTVEIPIYQLKYSDISLPISLSYDASGVKVASQPTWVGQNWSLKAGGMISRVIKGIPDETYIEEEIFLRTNGNNHITYKYASGFLYNASILKTSNWNSVSQIESWAKTGDFELEPDEFIFNFCGCTGKFYINENGKFVSSDKEYKIEALVYNNIPLYNGKVGFDPENPESFTYYKRDMMPNGMGGYIDGFVLSRVSRIMGFCITDGEGVKYYFGSYYKDKNEGGIDINTDMFYEIEITADFFSQLFVEEFSTWHLERIVSPRGNTVKFKYSIESPTVSFSSNYSVNKMSGSASSGLGWFFGGKVGANNFYAMQNLSGKFIRPVFLSEIQTPSEIIKFNRSNSNTLKYNYHFVHSFLSQATEKYDPNMWIPFYFGQLPIVTKISNYVKIVDYEILKTCKLDDISICETRLDNIVKKFKFEYQEEETTRLRLLSVTEQSNGYSLPKTEFEYNSMQLPGFLDIRNDHWGYYNNKLATVDYNSAADMKNYYNKREPDPAYTKAEILEKIKYPTGGTKEIVYESNIYNRVIKRNTTSGDLTIQSCDEKTGGGLRVRKIIENDGTNAYTKQYSYSPGILNGEIQYYWENYQGKLLNGNTYTADRFFTNSLLPVSNNSEGGSVSYTDVSEQNIGNGRTEYTFTNHDNTIDENSISIDLQKSPYSPLSGKAVERGKLLKSKTYKENASLPFLTETYKYSPLNNNMEYIPSVYIRLLSLFGSNEVNAIEGSAYKIYTYPYNIEKTETVYDADGQNQLTTTTDYTYNSNNLLSTTTTTNSDGKTQTTKFTYPFEIKDGTDTTVMRKMTEKNIIADYVEKVVCLDNGVSNKSVISGEYRKYNEVQSNIFKPERIDILQTQSPIPYETVYPWKNTYTPAVNMSVTSIFSAGARSAPLPYFNNSEKLKIRLHRKGKMKITKENEIDVYSKTFTSDHTEEITLPAGKYIVTLEKNNSISTYCYIEIRDRQTTIQNSANLQPETFYQYNNRGNVKEIKPAGNQTPTAYLWGYNNQYPIAEIHGASYNQVVAAIQGGQSTIDAIAESNTLNATDSAKISALRTNISNAAVTTYTYKPLIGMLSATDPRGVTTYYEYDDFGRLKRTYLIENEIEKTVQQYDYHYKNQ